MSVNNLKSKKAELRSKHKKLRDRMGAPKKADCDFKITERFLALPEYKADGVLLAFVSKDIEVDTSRIIAEAFADGKTVAVPRCDKESNTIGCYVIKSLDDLEKGFYGLLEPKPYCERVEDYSSALCMVPGLVFDREGYRLGFGKGYYDRFLIDFGGVTVGVCYSLCIEPKLPRGFYDRPVSLVVTDKYTIDTR